MPCTSLLILLESRRRRSLLTRTLVLPLENHLRVILAGLVVQVGNRREQLVIACVGQDVADCDEEGSTRIVFAVLLRNVEGPDAAFAELEAHGLSPVGRSCGGLLRKQPLELLDGYFPHQPTDDVDTRGVERDRHDAVGHENVDAAFSFLSVPFRL